MLTHSRESKSRMDDVALFRNIFVDFFVGVGIFVARYGNVNSAGNRQNRADLNKI